MGVVLLLFFVFSISCGFWARGLQAGDDVPAEKNVPYLSGSSSEAHELDIYLGGSGNQSPVFMFVHGGGWRRGSKNKSIYEALAETFAENGYLAVVPNYRLSGEAKHPAQIQDVAHAFAWICKNASQYGGNPEEIYIAGHSAGGHLVSLLATDPQYLAAVGLTPGRIKAVLAVSAVYDITELNRWSKRKMATPAFGDSTEAWKEASPINHVRPGLPPFLIVYAQRDPETLRNQAQRFAAALRASNDTVSVRELVREGHLSVARKRGRDNQLTQILLDYLETVR